MRSKPSWLKSYIAFVRSKPLKALIRPLKALMHVGFKAKVGLRAGILGTAVQKIPEGQKN